MRYFLTTKLKIFICKKLKNHIIIKNLQNHLNKYLMGRAWAGLFMK